jgi:hypothetical protein
MFGIDNNLILAGVLITVIIAVVIFKMTETFELIYPGPTSASGCMNIKASDLLVAFNGDINKLKGAMLESGVPLNLALTDANAPEIATYLVNNKTLGDLPDCKLVGEQKWDFTPA